MFIVSMVEFDIKHRGYLGRLVCTVLYIVGGLRWFTWQLKGTRSIFLIVRS